jgi:hypothetical protein
VTAATFYKAGPAFYDFVFGGETDIRQPKNRFLESVSPIAASSAVAGIRRDGANAVSPPRAKRRIESVDPFLRVETTSAPAHAAVLSRSPALSYFTANRSAAALAPTP